jgi:hypothetical protein
MTDYKYLTSIESFIDLGVPPGARFPSPPSPNILTYEATSIKAVREEG